MSSTGHFKAKVQNISVFNRQRKLRVDLKDLRDFGRRVASRLNLRAGFSVVLISDRAMRTYHSRYKGTAQTTDVLSFPTSDEAAENESYLGDILISVETAERQAKRDLRSELQVLSLHGLLHLMGYDHETDQGEMDVLEGRLLKEFQLQ